MGLLSTETNTCWIPYCEKEISPTHLMCARHWSKVPPGLQHAVNRTYRRGKGIGTTAYLAAIRAARDAVMLAEDSEHILT